MNSTPLPPTLLHVFPTFAVGGQQTRFVTIANHLGAAFRHDLVSLDGQYAALALLDPALDVTSLPQPVHEANVIKLFRRIGRLSAAAKPDILVTYNWGAIDWAIVNRLRLRFRRPHVHLEDGFGLDEANGQKWRRLLTRRLILQRSIVVVPSRNLEQIALTTWRISSENLVYIPNGINAMRFDYIPTSGLPFFQRQEGECVIGSFSPLRPEKNIGRLLRAFVQLVAARLPVRLVICGDGPERSDLSAMARGLGVAAKVTFTGHVPTPEAVMGAFDIFAITSDTEQMPYAVLEAMSARLPVVGTAVGDIAAIVSEENRHLIVPRNGLDQLASALAGLCANGEMRSRVGNANRAKVEQTFGIVPMVEAFRCALLKGLNREVKPVNRRV